jgi:NADPH2 dehydrogenase
MADPIPTFTYLVSQIAAKHPNFAYIHAPEPRVSGSADRTPGEGESNDFLRILWASGPGAEKRTYISAGGHTTQTAVEAVERAAANGQREAVAFGRQYISNVSNCDLTCRAVNEKTLTLCFSFF